MERLRRHRHLQTTPLLQRFPTGLSRACLGKPIAFSTKRPPKRRFPHLREGRRQRNRHSLIRRVIHCDVEHVLLHPDRISRREQPRHLDEHQLRPRSACRHDRVSNAHVRPRRPPCVHGDVREILRVDAEFRVATSPISCRSEQQQRRQQNESRSEKRFKTAEMRHTWHPQHMLVLVLVLVLTVYWFAGDPARHLPEPDRPALVEAAHSQGQ